MTDKTGGPAFPETRWDDMTRQDVQWTGMTLRDYFAAKAMQALINPKGESLDRITEVPEYAYQIADAMLKEREK